MNQSAGSAHEVKTIATGAQTAGKPGFRFRSRLINSLIRSKPALISALILLSLVVVSVFAPWIAGDDPSEINIAERLRPVGADRSDGGRYLLGTDTLGRDVFSRLIFGARISLLVGLSAVFIAGSVGVFLGLIAGFYGRWLDVVIMRLGDTLLAFPFILLAVSVMAVLGPGLFNVIGVLGLNGWVQYGRVVRGQVMSLREKEFVEGVRAAGARDVRIIYRHILPNTWAAVLVIASFSVASTIIAESSLSFLGLGVPANIPTWGAMLAEGREYLERAPWLVIFPGTAIAITVLAINVLGDWMRDYLDPHLRGDM